ncbi:hypothetical protein [Vibrio sonorensis]|uniref:hypothetical protein n=1 Tax=Vibrio sonorensis TaxID=1004316 RepID=UPI0008D9C62E|nr:hypothetical protein [Vibrio sonorensis]
MKITIVAIIALMLGIVGCAANNDPLGAHVAKLRSEQVNNPNASRDNLAVIPIGSGERMEGAYQIYTGKQSEELKGTDSQFLEGFGDSP